MTPFQRLLTVPFVALLLLAAACSDDDGEGSGDLAAFCELSGATGDVPTDDQVAQLRDSAPSDISDDVDTVLDALESGDFERLESDDVIDAEAAVDEFIAENCDTGGEGGDETSDDDAASDQAITSNNVPTDACTIDLALLQSTLGVMAEPTEGVASGSCNYRTTAGGTPVAARINTDLLYTEEQFLGQVVDQPEADELVGVGDLAAFETHGSGGVTLHVVLLDVAYITIDVRGIDATATDLVALFDSMS